MAMRGKFGDMLAAATERSRIAEEDWRRDPPSLSKTLAPVSSTFAPRPSAAITTKPFTGTMPKFKSDWDRTSPPRIIVDPTVLTTGSATGFDLEKFLLSDPEKRGFWR